MNKLIILFISFILICFSAYAQEWKGQWIQAQDCPNDTNTWQAYRKQVQLTRVPRQLIARISVDSKYWLWVNGQLVVFEGQLKRGPSPTDTYYDEVDLAPHLKVGQNTIAVLTCFFGREGFSHKNSGKAALLFDADQDGISILSDASWQAITYKAYGRVRNNDSNYRLPETCTRYDATLALDGWNLPNYQGCFPTAKVVEHHALNSTYGKLVKRPIPLFFYTQLLKYKSQQWNAETRKLRCQLPYDAQVTPYIKVKAKAGKTIDIRTDCFSKPGENSIRCEYLTRDGVQEYENYSWMNGNYVEYTIPEGVEVLDVRYRESGYATEIVGTFHCEDPFWNELWKRSARTLYVNMRDTYFDCPDRERAQWWGDMVNDIAENFYLLTPSSWQLIYKGIHELMNWQKPSGVIYSPIPAGNWEKELPCQMLMAVGLYGFYQQYYYSGDTHFIAPIYDRMHKYLHEVWKPNEEGFVPVRQGGWSWADWGTNIDLELITNEWYYLALSAEQRFAQILGKSGDEKDILALMEKMEQNFQKRYWQTNPPAVGEAKGPAFRSPDYSGATDDRAQALAVLCGFAQPSQYPHLLNVFRKHHYASPLIEQYVQTALFQMGEGKFALERARQQYTPMMEFKDETTVFEFWEYHGKGGQNHAWASGMPVIFSREVCGIRPTSPGFKTFQIKPQLAGLKNISTSFLTRYGTIAVTLKENNGTLKAKVTVPSSTSAQLIWQGKTYNLTSGRHSLTCNP